MLMQITKKYDKEYYGQLAYLEMAKIDILKRDYANGKKHLSAITADTIDEKYYWLAIINFKNNEPQEAIKHVKTYLVSSKDNNNKAYIILYLADYYIKHKNYLAFSQLYSEYKDSLLLHQIELPFHVLLSRYYQATSQNELAIQTLDWIVKAYPYSYASINAFTDLYELKNQKRPIIPKINNTTASKDSINSEDGIPTITPVNGKIFIQYAIFSTLPNAMKFRNELLTKQIKVQIGMRKIYNKQMFSVYTGPYTNKIEAAKDIEKAKEKDISCKIIEE